MILAIETSTPRASLALFDESGGGVIWERSFTSDRAHNSMIFEPLEEGLERCGRAIDRIVVGRGPGSYGGVRVGIAVANGLSLALGAPAAGLSSLEAMDLAAADYAVIGDARRASFFLARVESGKLRGEPDLLIEQGLVADLTLLRQRGLPVVTAEEAVAERFGAALVYPVAGKLAAVAAEWPRAKFEALAEQPLEPHYLRAPYITMPKK